MSETIETSATPLDVEPLVEDDEDIEITPLPPRRPAGARRRAWIIVPIVLILLALMSGGAFLYFQRSNQSPLQYTQQAVATGNLTLTVSSTGPVAPHATYNMDFTVQGQISEIDVKVGQQVKKGQVLAKVSSPSLQDALTQAQQSVTNAQTTYDDAVNNGASQTTLDSDYGQLQSAQDQLKTAQDNFNATILRAPGNAIVASINGVIGQSASSSSGSSSSSSTSTSFMTLVDNSSFVINALVNEADISSVQPGQTVAFTVEAYPTRTFLATVSSVGLVGQTSSNVVSYPVTLSVNSQNLGTAHLYSGMTATATIVTAQHTGVLLISNSALTFPTTAVQAGVITNATLINARRSAFSGGQGGGQGFGQGGQGGQGSGQRGTGQGGQGSGQGIGQGGQGSGQGFGQGNRRVVLVLRNGQLTPVVITVGLTNGVNTEVLSGLQAGDQVVVGATGGPFANLSTNSSTNTRTTGGGLFNRGTGGGGGGGGGGAGGGRGGN